MLPMLRKMGLLLVCGWILWSIGGCGINITLPGGSTTTCREKDKCNPGSGGVTSPGGTTAPGNGTTEPGGTTTPSTSDAGNAEPAPPPTEPPTKPATTPCLKDNDCKVGEHCVKLPQGEGICKQLGCSELRRDVCLQVRGRCFLEWLGHDKYLCREAAHYCEKKDLNSCSNDPICLLQHGNCYCPEDADCECGGGPPSNCKPYPCDGLESCQKYCMIKFGCCSPYGSCDDLHPGCNITQYAPRLCIDGPPCHILGKQDCDYASLKCTWSTASGNGVCVDK